MARKLTDKQRRFIRLYLDNGNAAAAYRTAYNSKASPAACANEANKLLKHPDIAPILSQADSRAEAATERALNRYEVTAERIIAGLAKLGFYDARDIFEWTESGIKLKASSEISDEAAFVITEISQTTTKDGGSIKIKLADKRAALVDLGRHKGLFIDKFEQGQPGDFDRLTPDELRDSIAQDLAASGAGVARAKSPRTTH